MSEKTVSIKEKIDKAFEFAHKYWLHVLGIKLTLDESRQFEQELYQECKYNRGVVAKRYRGARVIEGYTASIQGKSIESGLMCAFVGGDYGHYSISERFVPLDEVGVEGSTTP